MKNKKEPKKGKQPSPVNGSWLLRAHVCKLLQGMTAVKLLHRSAGGNSNNKDAVGKVRSSVLAERSYSVLTLMWFASPRVREMQTALFPLYTQGEKRRMSNLDVEAVFQQEKGREVDSLHFTEG